MCHLHAPPGVEHSVGGDGWISDGGLWFSIELRIIILGIRISIEGLGLELGVWISVVRVGIRVKGLGLGLGLVLGVRVMIVGLD